MIVGSIQCIYSYNGERYGHDVALEIERPDRFVYILTLSSIYQPEEARRFECHPYVLAAVLQGGALTVTDDISIEVTFFPADGMMKLAVKDLGIPYSRTFMAQFKLEDLAAALSTLEGVGQ